MEASVNIKQPRIKPDMLVMSGNADSVGLVTKCTRKWVHVTWLVHTGSVAKILQSEHVKKHNYHFTGVYKRRDLLPLPAGTKVSIKQKD